MVIVSGARIVMSESGGRRDDDPANCWMGPKGVDELIDCFLVFVVFADVPSSLQFSAAVMRKI